MSDHPIIFSGPMIQALLAGRKTQTRRILKAKPGTTIADFSIDAGPADGGIGRKLELPVDKLAVRFADGDRLWVREAAHRSHHLWVYAADGAEVPWPARSDLAGKTRDRLSPIFMPRTVSRLTLTVTDVRVERLQDISTADAMDEGIVQTWGDFGGDPPAWALQPGERGGHFYDNRTSIENYRLLWESINGDGSWAANPWCAVVEFQTIRKNIDEVSK